ncbi:MAG: DUF4258 domain-containing protein [Desulfobacterales bacterium]|nr:DUF4258 domain-containing protein [Desulfobacterales bacterium]
MADRIPKIRVTQHASRKLKQRGLQVQDLLEVITDPAMTKDDVIDPDLIHYISPYQGGHLRVIGKWEDGNIFVVVTAFVDRRIRREVKI